MQEGWALGWMGGVYYDPPDPVCLESQGGYADSYCNLWSALDAAYDDQDSIVLQKTDRLLAYRALLAAHGSDVMQTNWRWFLQLWCPADRDQFQLVMTHAHDELLRRNPQMQGLEY